MAHCWLAPSVDCWGQSLGRWSVMTLAEQCRYVSSPACTHTCALNPQVRYTRYSRRLRGRCLLRKQNMHSIRHSRWLKFIPAKRLLLIETAEVRRSFFTFLGFLSEHAKKKHVSVDPSVLETSGSAEHEDRVNSVYLIKDCRKKSDSIWSNLTILIGFNVYVRFVNFFLVSKI